MSGSIDIVLFWIAFWCYLAGFLAFALYISLRLNTIGTIGGVVMVLGFIPHTIGFFVRWKLADHVPLSNMYEYMSMMSWMAVLSLGILVFRYKKPIIGAFISPIVFMLMVTASMLPKEISQQLVPALQSYWLTIHVTLAALGSGAFAVAAAVSFIYLLKSGEVGLNTPKVSRSNLWVPGLASMLVLPWVFYSLGKLAGFTPTSSELLLSFGANPIHGTGSFFIAFGMYAPLGFLIWTFWHLRVVKKSGGGSPGATLFAVAFGGFLLGSLMVGLLISGGRIVVSPSSPYKLFEVLGLAYFASIPVFFVLLGVMTKCGFLERIPLNIGILDDINYKSVTLGYPLYTVGALFAGAIWAEQAWGQFWGWDPKEVGSLIIWLFYSGFLHAHYQRNWRGKRAAILSLCGFGMILLSFFGNYFFGGQHTYV